MSRESAVHKLSSNPEDAFHIDEDHSNMVKFSPDDVNYLLVCKCINKAITASRINKVKALAPALFPKDETTPDNTSNEIGAKVGPTSVEEASAVTDDEDFDPRKGPRNPCSICFKHEIISNLKDKPVPSNEDLRAAEMRRRGLTETDMVGRNLDSFPTVEDLRKAELQRRISKENGLRAKIEELLPITNLRDTCGQLHREAALQCELVSDCSWTS